MQNINYENKNINKDDSSETIREKVITEFNFINYIKNKPQHIKEINIHFLEWFIGFFEAEGSFCSWFDGKKNRCQIEISQKDPKLMFKIKKNLGFGNVTQFSKNKKFYWRYSTSKKDFLISFIYLFIYLFNGNLVSNHKKKMFEKFVQNFNKIYNMNFFIFQKNLQPSLNNAWLSGFLEGDGGFYVTYNNIIKTNIDGSQVYNFKMRFYIIQKNEEKLLIKIKEIFGIPSNIYQIHNGHTSDKYNRLETHQLKCHLLIVTYLDKFPFLGKRNITFFCWKRLLNYRINKYPITEKSIFKLKCLILAIKNNI